MGGTGEKEGINSHRQTKVRVGSWGNEVGGGRFWRQRSFYPGSYSGRIYGHHIVGTFPFHVSSCPYLYGVVLIIKESISYLTTKKEKNDWANQIYACMHMYVHVYWKMQILEVSMRGTKKRSPKPTSGYQYIHHVPYMVWHASTFLLYILHGCHEIYHQ